MPRRPALLALLLVAACGGDPAGPQSMARDALFDEVWGDFDRHYALFPQSGVDWGRARDAYRDSVVRAPSDAEAARLLGAMIGGLRDHHSDLVTPYGRYGAPAHVAERRHDPAVVRDAYLREPLRATGSGRIQYARLRGAEVGYLRVASFVGADWGNEVEAALGALRGTAGLVIDVRDNTGGNEDVARAVAARLYDRRRVYRLSRVRAGPGHADLGAPAETALDPGGAVRFAGPVVLLTNRYVASAAEDFVLMLRALPQARVVGDTTMGLGSNPAERTLRNGWRYRLSRSVQSTPDGFVYQWRGLPPHAAVPWPADASASGRDPYLDEALRRFGGASTSAPSPRARRPALGD
jgi:hypothetical protein